MKAKILGLVAAGLLAGPMAAYAVVIYDYTDVIANPSTDFSFSYAADTFISGDTLVPDYACLTSTCDIDFLPNIFADVLTVNVEQSPGVIFGVVRSFPIGSFGAVGSYDSFSPLSGLLLGSLVVREVAVPEPGTLALLGLGLAGLGLSRRRKAD